ncbi:hypothetical protein M1247_08360 [Mycobacterium sp. 21AC1]|uniref:hypothetical protein n=1 Tax=[Mycobacterium] appelbergii TaxID=2939269 RepID=UPI002938F258|nr:hypothetical protein [Mycobacterium sp. 21AC1]MDV3124921.1 hypothetical protein [Mycobacterium sp. 21AC1]
MNSMLRAAVGGVCVGSGIAIGAYSGGWFLLLAVALAVMGIGVIAGAFVRSAAALDGGDAVPVKVDLIDRSAPNLATASTVIAGVAMPRGDAAFRFHTSTNLARTHVAEVVEDGRGELPSGALGEPGDAPVTEHRVTRARVPAALTAVAAMWATMLVPPSDVWDLKPLTSSVSSALPEVATSTDPDERPLWQWYDEMLAHLRAESPELLDALLEIDVRDTYVTASVYLGGDQSRTYEGRTRGWETSESTTSMRSRDTFSVGDLERFSAKDYLSGATAMLPPDNNKPERLAIARTDSIFGAERPVLIDGWFGDPTVTVMGKPDGTIAPWWPADDVAAGLGQVEAALVARGVPTTEPDIKSIALSGNQAGFTLDFYRGDNYYSTGAHAGKFTDPDDSRGDSEYPRFRFSDVSPDIVAAVRDDAMRRYSIDPVDRRKADIVIAAWGSGGGDRVDEIVIEVNYHDAHGGNAVYSLAGEYLGEGE